MDNSLFQENPFVSDTAEALFWPMLRALTPFFMEPGLIHEAKHNSDKEEIALTFLKGVNIFYSREYLEASERFR